jgi:hypothetical protein
MWFMMILFRSGTAESVIQEKLVQKAMKTRGRLCYPAIAAIVTSALWLTPQSVARADQQTTTQRAQQPAAAPNAWAGTPFESRCTWPYRNQLPPCMSTWPDGDPNYHGSKPGTTFNR